MTYKIGTRVKKVRGPRNVGLTGIVCHGPAWTGYLLQPTDKEDCYVRFDGGWVDQIGRQLQGGSVGVAESSQWEAITDPGAAPGIKGTCEPLDKLLSEVSRETV